MTLDPGPALGFVENGDGLSEQKLGVETGGGQRLPAKWRQRPRNLRAAGGVARGLDDALQLLGRKIRAPGIEPRIGRISGEFNGGNGGGVAVITSSSWVAI